jgi:hypothetical protein
MSENLKTLRTTGPTDRSAMAMDRLGPCSFKLPTMSNNRTYSHLGDSDRGPLLAEARKRGFRVSSRSPTNLLCRRWSSEVHSTNSNCPTTCGLSHRHSTIFAAVRPAPQRPAFFSGKFAKGHSFISSGLSFLNSSALDAGVKPFLVRAA